MSECFLSHPPESAGIEDFLFTALWCFGSKRLAEAEWWRKVRDNLRVGKKREEGTSVDVWSRALARELFFAISCASDDPEDEPEKARLRAMRECAAELADVEPFPDLKGVRMRELLKSEHAAACALFPIATQKGAPAIGQVWVIPRVEGSVNPGHDYLRAAKPSYPVTVTFVTTKPFEQQSYGMAMAMAIQALGNSAFSEKLATTALCSGFVDAHGILGSVTLGNKLDLMSYRFPVSRALFLPSALKDEAKMQKAKPRVLASIRWVDTLTAAREDISGQWEMRPDNLAHHLERCQALLSRAGSLEEAALILERIAVLQEREEGLFEHIPLFKAEYFKARLSHANHTGNEEAATCIWREWTAFESQLSNTAGLRGLEFIADLNNKRAISLLDKGQFAEARDNVQSSMNLRRGILEAAGLKKDDLLGKLLGTYGQIMACCPQRETEAAEWAFKEAKEWFNDVADKDRQWLNLGHLFCDSGSPLEASWREVESHLFPHGLAKPVAGRNTQFLLALQAKALLVFGTSEQQREWLNDWTRGWNAYPQGIRSQHPAGLIFQSAARLVYACKWEHSGKAKIWFDAAFALLDRANMPILQRLAHIVRLHQKRLTPSADLECLREHVRKFNPLWPGYPPFANADEIALADKGRLLQIVDDALAQVPLNYW